MENNIVETTIHYLQCIHCLLHLDITLNKGSRSDPGWNPISIAQSLMLFQIIQSCVSRYTSKLLSQKILID